MEGSGSGDRSSERRNQGRCRRGKRLLLAIAFGIAPDAGAADLLLLFRMAQNADAPYAIARAAWAAAQERIPQGRAGLLPVASFSASTQFNDRDILFRDPTVPRSTAQFASNALTLSITQPLFRKQNLVAFDQAHTQVEQADAQLALAAQELILRVAQAYFDLLLAQDNVALAEAQRTAIAQQLNQARRSFEIGTAAITDVNEAQARFDLISAQEVAARNDVEVRRHALEQLIARDPPPISPLGPRFTPKPPEPAVRDHWVKLALENNVQVAVAERGLLLANQEIDRNRGARYPTLDAIASYSHTGTGSGVQGGVGNDTRLAVLGVQLALPLYQGGAVSSRIREAIANEDRARQELDNARRIAAFNARQSFLGVSTGTVQIRAFEVAVTSAQSQLTSTRRGHEVGVRTQVDVLNAQQQLFTARRDLAQAKYAHILSSLRLQAATGELTEGRLAVVNDWLSRSEQR